MTPLIDRIGRSQVRTIAHDARPREAAERMHEAGVGCLVVLGADGRPVGMLTDRDLALRIVSREHDPDDTRVSEAMSSPLVSVGPDAEVADVVRNMRKHGIRRIPIVDDDRLAGIVSFDDVTELLAEEMSRLGQGTRARTEHARRRGAVDRVAREVDEKLHEAGERLKEASLPARDALADQIDALRERLARAIDAMP